MNLRKVGFTTPTICWLMVGLTIACCDREGGTSLSNVTETVVAVPVIPSEPDDGRKTVKKAALLKQADGCTA